jgi:hypothetical protein
LDEVVIATVRDLNCVNAVLKPNDTCTFTDTIGVNDGNPDGKVDLGNLAYKCGSNDQ